MSQSPPACERLRKAEEAGSKGGGAVRPARPTRGAGERTNRRTPRGPVAAGMSEVRLAAAGRRRTRERAIPDRDRLPDRASAVCDPPRPLPRLRGGSQPGWNESFPGVSRTMATGGWRTFSRLMRVRCSRTCVIRAWPPRTTVANNPSDRRWSIARSGAATGHGWGPGHNRCSCRRLAPAFSAASTR
jgi:hypothetical protein